MRFSVLFAAFLAVAPLTPALAQQSTLADIRAELSILYGDILTLKQQLDPTGLRTGSTDGSTPLDRLISIEQSLQVLTARTEELEYRIDRIVSDGTNRVGDLEFRLCELEAGCDIGALGETPSLGGGTETPVSPVFGGIGSVEGDQLAMSERADFEAAQLAMEEQRYQDAEQLFDDFIKSYPGGPLGVQAQMGRGRALELLGNPREAGRAYLAAFNLNTEGPEAPRALLLVGRMIAATGQIDQACLLLGEVGRRFPSSKAALDASDSLATMSCE